ncbi:MbtH family protein [Streptomyces beigongshangae]|uniref:MbtH family protein n=1 Tax=Streptomyces beigongshangae TaxID=2841597 RepID=UPI001C845A8D|nr:MbtH family protein [Streptomyces sp. REN17]
MTPEPDDDDRLYKVVVNHEEQYSVWPADRDNPAGWSDAGRTGPKSDCLAHIEDVWTDMRPLSLRRHLRTDGQDAQDGPVAEGADRTG